MAQVKFYVIKVLDETGGGDPSKIALAIRECADIGADIINLSLTSGYSQEMADEITYAWNAGSLLVAAAGNNGIGTISFPANHSLVIATTCVDQSKALCSFSNTGPEAELTAPGLGVWSTGLRCFQVGDPPQWFCNYADTAHYVSLSGTSMSTPHVSGVAALVKSYNPTLTNQQIRDRLNDSAEDLGVPGQDGFYGWGLVNAYGAVVGVREASLQGTVRDADTGAPIRSVFVKMPGQNQQTSTNFFGFYSFSALWADTWTIQFNNAFYYPHVQDVTLEPGSNQLDVYLVPKPGGPPPGPRGAVPGLVTFAWEGQTADGFGRQGRLVSSPLVPEGMGMFLDMDSDRTILLLSETKISMRS